MIQRSNFPHVIRTPDTEAEIFAAGGPVSIATLAGDDARDWDEATPHVFKPFPVALSQIGESTPIVGLAWQYTIPAAADPRPLRGGGAGVTAAYDAMFLRLGCRQCIGGRCDMRRTGHWGHLDSHVLPL